MHVLVVMRQGEKFIINPYVKPINTQQNLETSSCHVFNLSLCLIVKRYDLTGYVLRCNEMEQWLKVRGYTDGLVRE